MCMLDAQTFMTSVETECATLTVRMNEESAHLEELENQQRAIQKQNAEKASALKRDIISLLNDL